MLKALRTAIHNYASRRKAESYRRGYDYAAGALTRHEETLDGIQAKIMPGDKDEFDRGMLDAARKLVGRGFVEDSDAFPSQGQLKHAPVPPVRRQGFDHAMGALLRGEETPLSLEAPLLAMPKGDYKTGILDAIERAVALGLVADIDDKSGHAFEVAKDADLSNENAQLRMKLPDEMWIVLVERDCEPGHRKPRGPIALETYFDTPMSLEEAEARGRRLEPRYGAFAVCKVVPISGSGLPLGDEREASSVATKNAASTSGAEKRRLEAEIDALRKALQEIGDFAHDHSTGPAVPDPLWEVRGMAFNARKGADHGHHRR